jgi:hypothetical protein
MDAKMSKFCLKINEAIFGIWCRLAIVLASPRVSYRIGVACLVMSLCDLLFAKIIYFIKIITCFTLFMVFGVLPIRRGIPVSGLLGRSRIPPAIVEGRNWMIPCLGRRVLFGKIGSGGRLNS